MSKALSYHRQCSSNSLAGHTTDLLLALAMVVAVSEILLLSTSSTKVQHAKVAAFRSWHNGMEFMARATASQVTKRRDTICVDPNMKAKFIPSLFGLTPAYAHIHYSGHIYKTSRVP